MTRAATPSLAVACALLLSGCAGGKTDFPSLARRPVERLTGTIAVAQPNPEPTPAPPDPALLDKIGTLVATAHEADSRFQTRIAATRARILAAAGTPVASEEWSVATVALSDLEATRSEAMIALADLDALFAAAVVDGADAEALAKAHEEVISVIAGEDRVLEELQGGLAN